MTTRRCSTTYKTFTQGFIWFCQEKYLFMFRIKHLGLGSRLCITSVIIVTEWPVYFVILSQISCFVSTDMEYFPVCREIYPLVPRLQILKHQRPVVFCLAAILPSCDIINTPLTSWHESKHTHVWTWYDTCCRNVYSYETDTFYLSVIFTNVSSINTLIWWLAGNAQPAMWMHAASFIAGTLFTSRVAQSVEHNPCCKMWFPLSFWVLIYFNWHLEKT